MTQLFRAFGLLPLLLLLLAGCDLFGTEDDDPRTITTGVIVGNSGNFGDQNGFITVHDPVTGATVDFDDLGGFVNSITLHGGAVYAVLNTFSTGRIDALALDQGSRLGQIQDVPIPRYLAFGENFRGYVTNFSFTGNGFVNVIDFDTSTLVGDPIEVGTFPEGILVVGDEVFVANNGSSGAGTTLSVISTATSTVIDTIELGCDGPKEIMLDADDELVVVCRGKTVFNADFTAIIEQTNGQVVFVDVASRSVTARIPFDVQISSTNGSQAASYSPDAEELYLLDPVNSHIFRVDTRSNEHAGILTVPSADDLAGLSGVAYDADQERLYVGRLAQSGGFASFTDAGAVVVLDRNGTQVDRFPVGPAPAHIMLRQETQ